jgi:UDP-3-O-[3-hydroxymyristoyl] glucosamine N-acyltransferase
MVKSSLSPDGKSSFEKQPRREGDVLNLKEIADHIGGRLVGDASVEIAGANGIGEAQPGQITFLSGPKHLAELKVSRASAVIVAKEIETDKAQVIHPNPALGFARILGELHPLHRPKPGVDARAAIGDNVKLGKNVSIAAFAVVGCGANVGDGVVLHSGVVVGDDCTIGADCILHPQVTLYPGTEIGNRVIIHAGATIGADGFGYTPDEKGSYVKIHQIGKVIIEDDVEIGANSCIDRAGFTVTRVKAGTKIDNLVQVGHNCTIGEHCILVAQSGVSGSSVLGQHVIVGGQVGISDHVVIGDNVSLMAKSGVMRDLESNTVQGGSPCLPRLEYGKTVAITQQLPKWVERIKDLEKRLSAIENKGASS